MDIPLPHVIAHFHRSLRIYSRNRTKNDLRTLFILRKSVDITNKITYRDDNFNIIDAFDTANIPAECRLINGSLID